ncbi:synaptonemal complex protein 2-like [Leucoraja erinacea]|uniref:synaptonemal complex protein 2-like n=1 Tax=Leucoraja erinaceus TaxID=7782 RepID=UPI002453DF35|nr:synaptonemal complex protein 2-like [Leucoraja erinacea]
METPDVQDSLLDKLDETPGHLQQSVFDFELASDSAEKLQVRTSKRKLLGKKGSRTDEMQSLKVAVTSRKSSRSEKVMWKRSVAKKFFTEDSCSDDTVHSWLAKPQPKPRPKSADYSRRKKRRKSELRVLPLSLECSEDDEQKKGEVTLRKGAHITPESPVGTKMKFMTAVGLEMLTPPDTLQDKSSALIKIPRGASKITAIPANDGVSGDAAQQSPPPTSPGQDIHGANMEAASSTPLPLFRPKRLFTSAESIAQMEQIAERRQTELQDACLNDEQDLSTAFHSFTEGMRKKLKLCHRRAEQSSWRALRSSEEQFSTLMAQIRTCRMQKLRAFEVMMTKELKNLEEDLHTLNNMEEENLNFWKQQSLKFSQFYEKQQQSRLNILMFSSEDKPGLSKWF